jgi:hypothetical protein
MGTGGSFPGVKVTNHLHLVPRSRMRGSMPPFPKTPSWRGAQLKNKNFTFWHNEASNLMACNHMQPATLESCDTSIHIFWNSSWYPTNLNINKIGGMLPFTNTLIITCQRAWNEVRTSHATPHHNTSQHKHETHMGPRNGIEKFTGFIVGVKRIREMVNWKKWTELTSKA